MAAVTGAVIAVPRNSLLIETTTETVPRLDISGHLFIPLLALHILVAAEHAIVDKSGIARRMFSKAVAEQCSEISE